MNMVDPILHEKVEIGLPHQPISVSQEAIRKFRQQQRTDGELERAARHRKCKNFQIWNFDVKIFHDFFIGYFHFQCKSTSKKRKRNPGRTDYRKLSPNSPRISICIKIYSTKILIFIPRFQWKSVINSMKKSPENQHSIRFITGTNWLLKL